MNWELLKKQRKILLYGMGNGADKLLDIFERENIKCDGVFASDEFVRGQTFRGYKVMTHDQAAKQFGDFAVVLAFATELEEIMRRIEGFSREHVLFCPDLPVFGEGEFTPEHYAQVKARINKARSILSDEASRRVLDALVEFKLTGDISLLPPITTTAEQDERMLGLKNAVFADLGAYDGDTAIAFAKLHPDYESIAAFEPDAKNFVKLQRNTEGMRGVTCYNMAAWSGAAKLPFSNRAGRNSAVGCGKAVVRADALDNVLDRVTYAKLDVEGAEREALLGMKRLIQEYKPALKVSAYHRLDDFFELPILLSDMGYGNVALRKNPYYPAWETIAFAWS